MFEKTTEKLDLMLDELDKEVSLTPDGIFIERQCNLWLGAICEFITYEEYCRLSDRYMPHWERYIHNDRRILN